METNPAQRLQLAREALIRYREDGGDNPAILAQLERDFDFAWEAVHNKD